VVLLNQESYNYLQRVRIVVAYIRISQDNNFFNRYLIGIGEKMAHFLKNTARKQLLYPIFFGI